MTTTTATTMTEQTAKKWTVGEAVSPNHFNGPMEWVDYEDAIDRLNVNTFLGRWGGDVGRCDRLAFCVRTDEADILALGYTDEDVDGTWRIVDCPDQILVPVLDWASQQVPPTDAPAS